MRAIALGVVLGFAIGCGATSGFQSFGIVKDVMVEGKTAMEDADKKMAENRYDAAYVIMRRHINAVDAAIDKVKKDGLIGELDKQKTLLVLQDYRHEFQASSNRVRAMMTFESDFDSRIRGSSRMP